MLRGLLQNPAIWPKAAVYEEEKTVTYETLAKKANAIESALGDANGAMLVLPNGADFIAAFFGALQTGKAVFPVNPALKYGEIEALLKKSKLDTLITNAQLAKELSGLAARIVLIESLAESGPDEAPNPTAREVSEDEPMLFLSTSGTTGNVKIVCLSERSIKTSVLNYEACSRVEQFEGEKLCFILGTPFASVYAVLMICVFARMGYSVAITPDKLTPDSLCRTIETYKVTHFEGGPAVAAILERIAARPVPYDLSSLVYCVFAGGDVPIETMRKLASAFPNVAFYKSYGMTETGATIAKSGAYRPDKLASVGVPSLGTEVKIETDGRLHAEAGLAGEILVRGPSLMLGYYEN